LPREIDNGVPLQGDLIIPLEKVPVAAFQALYHQLTRKTEELEKSYNQTVKLDILSIQDLHHHFQQTVSQYNIQASDAEVVLGLSNGEIHRISSVEKFTAINWSSFTSSSTSVSIRYSFLIVNPNGSMTSELVAQPFSLTVIMERRAPQFRFGQLDFVPTHDYTNGDHPTRLGCRSKISYSDVAVGRTIQVLVDDWVNRWAHDDRNAMTAKTIERLKENGFPVVVGAVLCALLSGIFFEVPAYKDLITPMRYLLIVLGLVVVAGAGGAYISSEMSDLGDLMDARSVISITRGDIAQFESLERQRRKARSSLNVAGIVVGVGIIVGLFVNALSAWMLS
jgi:hypothetical protein